MSGWVVITRGLLEHDAFASEPFTEREAWLWMICQAAWKDTKHRVGKRVFDVPRGSFFASLRQMQSAWQWRSDARVRNFLDMLESERMIERTKNAQKTQITICKYDTYQKPERTENAETNARKTQAERTKERNKQDNTTATRRARGRAL